MKKITIYDLFGLKGSERPVFFYWKDWLFTWSPEDGDYKCTEEGNEGLFLEKFKLAQIEEEIEVKA